MRNKERKKVIELREITTGFGCDNCGKVSNGEHLPSQWHEFVSQHYEWGGDSSESIEGHHVCSPACYVSHFAKVVSEISGYGSAQIDEMELYFAELLVEHFDKPKTK